MIPGKNPYRLRWRRSFALGLPVIVLRAVCILRGNGARFKHGDEPAIARHSPKDQGTVGLWPPLGAGCLTISISAGLIVNKDGSYRGRDSVRRQSGVVLGEQVPQLALNRGKIVVIRRPSPGCSSERLHHRRVIILTANGKEESHAP